MWSEMPAGEKWSEMLAPAYLKGWIRALRT